MIGKMLIRLTLLAAAFGLALGFQFSGSLPAFAGNPSDAGQLAEKSKLTFDRFSAMNEMGQGRFGVVE